MVTVAIVEPAPVAEQIAAEIEKQAKPIRDVAEVGRIIGIPVVVRPWWGSRRHLFETVHVKCGKRVMHDYRGWWCFDCGRVVEKDVKVMRAKPARWVCAAGGSQRLKWPAVDGDKVIMWEGRCGATYRAAQKKRYNSKTHVHRQDIEVLDYTATAMLVRISVNKHGLSFLIGRDDGRLFIHPVNRHQKTVAEAFDYMVPVPVFQAMMHGFDCPRQGDWFFVPREFWHANPRPIKNVERRLRPWPGRKDAQSTMETGCIYSGAPLRTSRHVAEMLIGTYPFEMVKGTIEAPDHPPLKLEDWHCAVQNIRPATYNPDGLTDDD